VQQPGLHPLQEHALWNLPSLHQEITEGQVHYQVRIIRSINNLNTKIGACWYSSGTGPYVQVPSVQKNFVGVSFKTRIQLFVEPVLLGSSYLDPHVPGSMCS
jgi:hypothetical protein